MKHGIKGLPYTIVRERYLHEAVASCSVDGCNSTKHISLAHWLPADVVSKKIEEAGWKAHGHFLPGVPRSFVCPKHKEETNPNVKEDVDISLRNLNLVGSQEIINVDVAISEVRTSGWSGHNMEIHIPDDVVHSVGAKTFWVDPQKNNSSAVVLHLSKSDDGKNLYLPPNGRLYRATLRKNTSPIAYPQKRIPRVGVDAFLNVQTGTITIPKLPQEFRDFSTTAATSETQPKVPAAKKPQPTKAHRAPASPAIQDQTFNVEDGGLLREQINAWASYMDGQGWEVQLIVEENRLNVQVSKAL